MLKTPFEMMQMAVDIVHTSPHPTNKIAVAIAGTDADGIPFEIASTNEQPAALQKILDNGEKIGSASPTIRFTDVYIDHKGFEKDFFERRKDSVTLSFDILEDAGISVHKISRKNEQLETLITADPADTIDRSGVLMAAHDKSGNTVSLYTEPARHGTKHDTPCGKYSLSIQPLNRAFMLAARHGLIIDRNTIITSHVPTSREFVNAIGAGITTLHILDKNNARDEQSMRALKQLMETKIITIKS